MANAKQPMEGCFWLHHFKKGSTMKNINTNKSLSDERQQKVHFIVTFPVVEPYTLKTGVRVKPGMRVWVRV